MHLHCVGRRGHTKNDIVFLKSNIKPHLYRLFFGGGGEDAVWFGVLSTADVFLQRALNNGLRP